jgi:hypothetical protein
MRTIQSVLSILGDFLSGRRQFADLPPGWRRIIAQE